MSETHFNIYKAISKLGNNNQALNFETTYEAVKNYFVCSIELCTTHLVTKHATILRIFYDLMQKECLGKVTHSSLYTAVFIADRLTKLYSSNENCFVLKSFKCSERQTTRNISDIENNSFVINNHNVYWSVTIVLTCHIVFMLCFTGWRWKCNWSAITSKLQHSKRLYESEPGKPTNVLLP